VDRCADFRAAGAVLALVWFIRRQEHLLAPWRKVAQRPMAMGAALVLGVFVVIGLLDSLHYRRGWPTARPTRRSIRSRCCRACSTRW
jgi:peptide/nickel transport system permease protein